MSDCGISPDYPRVAVSPMVWIIHYDSVTFVIIGCSELAFLGICTVRLILSLYQWNGSVSMSLLIGIVSIERG